MTRISRFATALSFAALNKHSLRGDNADPVPLECHSYGLDFQNNGHYFQNSLSTDNFTFVQEFDDCNRDESYNILVDPAGNQELCTNTELTPDDVPRLSTCPIRKNQLVSGNWSIIIISNNGDGYPLAAQRDFVLSVGPQSTSTYTPTVSATLTTSAIYNETVTTTHTTTSVLDPSTVVVPSITVKPTTTVTPARVTSTTSKAILTVKLTSFVVDIGVVIATQTATCTPPTKPALFDPRAVIAPTVGPAAALAKLIFPRNARSLDKQAARSGLDRRAPDPQPLIVTEKDSQKWTTSTIFVTGSTITATVTDEATATVVETPRPVTVKSGETFAPRVTVTAPTPTKMVTKYIIAKSITTKTIGQPFTITMTTTPASVKASCTAIGGHFR